MKTKINLGFAVLIMAVFTLASCGNSGQEYVDNLDKQIEKDKYKPAKATLDTMLFTGDDKKLWMLDASTLPEGVEAKNCFYSFKLAKNNNWIVINYDNGNTNPDVKYHISKDTLVFEFYPIQLMKFHVKSINDSTMVLNDLTNNKCCLTYRNTKTSLN